MNQQYNGASMAPISTWTYGVNLAAIITDDLTAVVEGRREAKEAALGAAPLSAGSIRAHRQATTCDGPGGLRQRHRVGRSAGASIIASFQKSSSAAAWRIWRMTIKALRRWPERPHPRTDRLAEISTPPTSCSPSITAICPLAPPAVHLQAYPGQRVAVLQERLHFFRQRPVLSGRKRTGREPAGPSVRFCPHRATARHGAGAHDAPPAIGNGPTADADNGGNDRVSKYIDALRTYCVGRAGGEIERGEPAERDRAATTAATAGRGLAEGAGRRSGAAPVPFPPEPVSVPPVPVPLPVPVPVPVPVSPPVPVEVAVPGPLPRRPSRCCPSCRPPSGFSTVAATGPDGVVLLATVARHWQYQRSPRCRSDRATSLLR